MQGHSAAVQSDFDELITAAFDLAQMRLDTEGDTGIYAVLKPRRGELVALELGPEQVRAAVASGAEDAEHALVAQVRAAAADYLAVGIVCTITALGAQLVRLDLEHRDGLWQTLLLPFTGVGSRHGVEFGELQNTPGVQRIWGDGSITP